MDCVILNSAVCCENCTNLLLFIWSKPFLFTQQKHLLQTQIATPTLEFSSLLYCYYLNSGTHNQVEVRSFFLCIFPFKIFHLQRKFSTFCLHYGKAMGALTANPYCHQAIFSLVILREPGCF